MYKSYTFDETTQTSTLTYTPTMQITNKKFQKSISTLILSKIRTLAGTAPQKRQVQE